MAELELHYTTGIRCDKCSALWRFPRAVKAYGIDITVARAEARNAGWTRWVGRSVRHYCPNCKPSSRSKLEQRELHR